MLTTTISTPLKNLDISVDTENELLLGIHYSHKQVSPKPHDMLTLETIRQLNHYFKNSQHHFDLPLHFDGTEHQSKLWQALTEIPIGETQTYGELAMQIKSCAQAIGNACRSNPISIIIPCHRVVAKTGMGGYSGKTGGSMLEIKNWLLQHEANRT